MAYDFYKAHINSMYKTPQDNWASEHQAILNDTWENNPNVYTIKAQQSVGSNTYIDESVQINSVINPSTGDKFGDKYRKIIHKTYATASPYLGKMYQFKDKYWITINTNTIEGSLKTSIVRECDNTLKWTDTTGTLRNWQCAVGGKLSSTNFDLGSQGVAEINADLTIWVQLNSQTSTIEINQRVLFNGKSYRLTQIDNHFSPTLAILFFNAVEVQPNDDINGNIANADNVAPTSTQTKILPQTNRLIISQSQIYTVYKYLDGVANADTFTIVATGADSPSNYEFAVISGNSFSVLNKAQSTAPLTITCTNAISAESIVFTIILGGNW